MYLQQLVLPYGSFKMKKNELAYPSLVILAWAKAVEGNLDLQKWLLENNYNELLMASQAVRLHEPSRIWLLENGYPELMAMISAAEGNPKAQKWLQQFEYDVLYHIAMAVDHEQSSWLWLRKNTSPELIILAKSIQVIKDRIEDNHNDVHAIHKDL